MSKEETIKEKTYKHKFSDAISIDFPVKKERYCHKLLNFDNVVKIIGIKEKEGEDNV